MKRRKTSLPDNIIFNEPIPINYPIPPESIQYATISSITLYSFFLLSIL